MEKTRHPVTIQTQSPNFALACAHRDTLSNSSASILSALPQTQLLHS